MLLKPGNTAIVKSGEGFKEIARFGPGATLAR